MQIKHLYQPVYNLVTKKIVGHEALLRGPNNEGPAEVLDVAARCGRLRETDVMSFSMAVAGAPPGIAFANILPEILVWLVRLGVAIAAGRRAPGGVCIEIVEASALSSVFPRFLLAIEAVRAAGFKLAVDDISSGNDLRARASMYPRTAPETS